jgi:hypothetical protein
MSARSDNGSYEVFLSPPSRGAPDDLRHRLEALLRRDAGFDIASQQMSDRGIVSALADIRSVRNRRARVFVESRYLTETSPLPPHRIWVEGGDRESNRQCFAALSRAAIEVRADVVGGELQHVNFILARGDSERLLLVTSANLAPGSIDKHLNWAVEIALPGAVDAASEVFEAIWDGDFRGAAVSVPLSGAEGEFGRVTMGADGEAVDAAVTAIGGATSRIRFAYFTMSRDTRIVQALLAAVGRGVDVAGIVDADQGFQPWNAVPQLRDGGVDARYYPGALTGASGRMHHKTIVVDRSLTYLATANASQAAERSFELAVTLEGTEVAGFVDSEILRLGANASVVLINPR